LNQIKLNYLSVGAYTKSIQAPDCKSDKPELSPKPYLPLSRERAREREKEKDRESGKFAALQKWLKGEEGRHISERRGSPGRLVFCRFIIDLNTEIVF
jgi:hypothetical protein